MPGLQLRMNLAAGGNATPLLPASAAASTSNAGSISQQAYGITSGGDSQRSIAGYGSVGVGVAALLIMAYLWWSLPR